MAGKVLTLEDVLVKDDLGCRIADKYHEWNTFRRTKVSEWTELRKYLFATDTTETSNSTLPWKNKTTLPKLCQIRDNLYANYMRSLFPKRKWMYWEAYDKPSNDPTKRRAIEAYMIHSVERSAFKSEMAKAILDWIDYGNVFVIAEWKDGRVQTPEKDQHGYVGPGMRRISPLDIVFNPIAPSFEDTPKIIRSLVEFGEVKEMLEAISTDANKVELDALWSYLKELRHKASDFSTDDSEKNELFQVDGFSNYTNYLKSGFAEVLTFYGDIYDAHNDVFYKNHVIKVVDRHKIIDLRPNESIFGKPQIFHCPWRVRQDNLWGMGPLDNLVGMQYRIDHVENLKADLFDLTAFPPLLIKGYVGDFEWGPFTKIITDTDSDVKLLSPDVQALNANIEIADLANKMEEMAGAPKEAMGFRTPGEKTMYEVQRLENAAGRIFQSKIELFEELIVEPSLSAMLELAKRKLPPQEIAALDEEYQTTFFLEITKSDLTGSGKIRPVAARNFAEKAEKVQNVTAWFGSAVGQDPNVMNHVSGLNTAKMMEDLLDLEGYDLIQENIRIQEQSDTMRLANAQTEEVQMEAMTPSGITADDYTT